MKPIKIGDLADLLHRNPSRHRALALLHAYFDESGTHDGSRVTAIAGFVGTKAAWEAVEKRWIAVLAEFADKGVRTFHMTDCSAQTREFAGVDAPGRNYIITQLSRVLGEQDVRAVSSAVVVDDWNAVVTEPAFLERFPEPFDLCFDDVVRKLWEWGAKYAAGEKVAPVFAHNPQHHDRMVAFSRSYSAEGWYRQILGPITFGYPDEMVPLQGADLIAHQINWHIERRRFGKLSGIDMGRTVALDNAAGGQFVHGHWFEAEALASTVKRFCDSGEIYPLSSPPSA